MRVIAPCATCASMNPPDIRMLLGWVSDSGLVSVKCPLGHESAVVYQTTKYMLLMQSSCLAYLDGHLRESVSGMAASLERCYEFFIQVALASRGVKPELVAQTWKVVSNQSERQFGGFLFLYLLSSGQVFASVQDVSAFRNRVIHQGYIPTAEEVLNHGRRVFALLLTIEWEAEKLDREAVSRVDEAGLELQIASVPKGSDFVKLRAMIVRVNENNEVVGMPETFDELAAGMKKRLNGIDLSDS